MAKKNKTIDNIDDLIIAAKEAGLSSIVEQAKNLNFFLNHLKKLGNDGIMTFEEFFNLKEGDKYIFVCHQDDEYSFSSIEEKGELEINTERKSMQFSTSSGDPTVDIVEDVKSEMKLLYELSDSEYQYSLYKLRTRKTKIKKILENE